MVAKEAVIFFDSFIVTIHNPVPEHPSPLHPVNIAGGVAVAVSVTVVLFVGVYVSEQSSPQLTHAGEDVIFPKPFPHLETDNE